MALAMSRPYKHPKTGVYWFRKRVPEAAQPLVGKLEIRRSLGTKDATEAKHRLLAALTELETQWANLRAGLRTLTEREAHDLAVRFQDWWIDLHKDNPSQQAFWPLTLGGDLWPPLRLDTLDELVSEEFWTKIDKNIVRRYELERWCEHQADEHLKSQGLIVDDVGRLKMAKAIAAAMQRASLTLAQFAEGNFTYHLSTPRGAIPSDAVFTKPSKHQPTSFRSLLNGWAKEKKPATKTVYEWGNALDSLAKFLGHDDATRLEAADLLRWKTALIDAGLSAKTIRDAKLASVRAVFRWAVENRHVSVNPAEAVSIDVKANLNQRKRGYTSEEASKVLKAALEARDPVRRWIPWLCAYSGARLSEICQLRVEDIIEMEGLACMRITAEAGSVKNENSERIVPLHAAVKDSGFLRFRRGMRYGPLFPKLSPDRFGNRGGNGTKVLGRWVRSLGVTDPRIAPNHAWRHRFTTLRRQYGLAEDLAKAIVGHAPQSVADFYGAYPIQAMYRELTRILQRSTWDDKGTHRSVQRPRRPRPSSCNFGDANSLHH